MSHAAGAALALTWREVARFAREPNRVFGALAQPVLFWALFGAGLRASFRLPAGEGSLSYAEYFFPGTVILILLFTAIFSTISLIEDRREGFLQGVLVAPVPRWSIVLGKVLGGTVLAVAQGFLIVLCAPLTGIPLTPGMAAAALPVLFVIAFGLTALSFCIAWKMESTQGFHAVMTVLLMPLWLLSGAFFPAAGAPAWLGWVMHADPLTYGLAVFRHLLYPAGGEATAGLPALRTALAVTVLFGVAAFAAALVLASPRRRGGAA